MRLKEHYPSCLHLQTRRWMATRTGCVIRTRGITEVLFAYVLRNRHAGSSSFKARDGGSLRGLCAAPRGRASTGLAGPSRLFTERWPWPGVPWVSGIPTFAASPGLRPLGCVSVKMRRPRAEEQGGAPAQGWPGSGPDSVTPGSHPEPSAASFSSPNPAQLLILLASAHTFFLPENGLFPSAFLSATCLENHH